MHFLHTSLKQRVMSFTDEMLKMQSLTHTFQTDHKAAKLSILGATNQGSKGTSEYMMAKEPWRLVQTLRKNAYEMANTLGAERS